jgi:amino acid transporter
MPETPDVPAGHVLKKELRLRDLVQMQILLVVGVTWIGIAAHQGGTHILYWLAAIVTFFLPSAAVVGFCVKIWPQEGGVYQWTRHAFGPFAGFMSAWNFAIWALLTVAPLGLQIATSLSYALGPRFSWMAESHNLSTALNIGLFAVILLICVPGFGIGKYVSHFGTAVMVLVNVVLAVLIFYHPHTSPAHPHVNPQPVVSFGLSAGMLSVLSLNLFSKMAFNALTGLEQIAVFAGETRDAARAVLRSAWLAAPLIAIIFILGTVSLLTYIPAQAVDLVGPVPQVLAAAFGGGGGGAASSGPDWGLILGRTAILGLALTVVAQYALIVAETSRLPLVAGWDGIVPAWFTRLSPRFGTPVRSIVVIVVLGLLAGFLATSGVGKQEAFQLLVASANISYALYYGMMLLIPVVVGARFGKAASPWLKIAATAAFIVTALALVMNVFPIVDVASPVQFGLKVIGVALLVNAIGAALYFAGRGRTSPPITHLGPVEQQSPSA